MSAVQANIRLGRHDDIYERLVKMHDGLSEDDSRKLNAKLILALINQVGDADVILKLFDMVEANHSGISTSKSNNEDPKQ